LIKILARELWGIQPVWKNATEDFIDKIEGTTAGLVIGDRAFDLNDRYQHSYDLGSAWKKLTGLPFVFACWVGKKNISRQVLESFNEALMFGVQAKKEVVESQETMDSVDLKKYLEERIVFEMTEDMKQGLNSFFKYLSTL
jgi:chorismate dehydratase